MWHNMWHRWVRLWHSNTWALWTYDHYRFRSISTRVVTIDEVNWKTADCRRFHYQYMTYLSQCPCDDLLDRMGRRAKPPEVEGHTVVRYRNMKTQDTEAKKSYSSSDQSLNIPIFFFFL